MINMKSNKRRKLSGEILGLLAVTLVLALILLQFLGIVARAMIDSFLFMRDIVLTEAQYAQLDDWVFHLSLLVSVAFLSFCSCFCWESGFPISAKCLRGSTRCEADRRTM